MSPLDRLAAAESVAAHAAELIRNGATRAPEAAPRLLRAEWDAFWHHLSLHSRLPSGGPAPADGWYWADCDDAVDPDAAPPHAEIEVPDGSLRWQGQDPVAVVEGVVSPEEAADGQAAFSLGLREAVRRWLAAREVEFVVVRVNRRDSARLRAALRDGLAGVEAEVVRE